MVDLDVCSHDRQPCILFIGQKRSVLEMDETQVMAAANSSALLSKKHEHAVVFKRDLRRGCANNTW